MKYTSHTKTVIETLGGSLEVHTRHQVASSVAGVVWCGVVWCLPGWSRQNRAAKLTDSPSDRQTARKARHGRFCLNCDYREALITVFQEERVKGRKVLKTGGKGVGKKPHYKYKEERK